MPDPPVPENTPAPKRPAGRKRGRRGTAGSVPPARPQASPPAAPAAKSSPARTITEAPGEAENPVSPATVPPPAAEIAAPADVVETGEAAGAAEISQAAIVDVAPEDDDSPPAPAASAAATPEPVTPEPQLPPVPERGLATILGGAPVAGRPTWLDVPPERIGSLLAVFADEGARLLAMTVLPAPESADAPLTLVDLRYHFVVEATPITVSTRTPRRSAPSAAGPFPAMTWRERELAGEYGLRFVEPVMDVAETPDEGSGIRDQGSATDDKAPDLLSAGKPDP